MGLGTKKDPVMTPKTWILPIRHYLRALAHACENERVRRGSEELIEHKKIEFIVTRVIHNLLDVESSTLEFPIAEDRILAELSTTFSWFDSELTDNADILFYDEAIYGLYVEFERILSQMVKVDLWSAWSVEVDSDDLYIRYLGDQRIIEWQLQNRLKEYDGKLEQALSVDYAPRRYANSDSQKFAHSLYGDRDILRTLQARSMGEQQAKESFARLQEVYPELRTLPKHLTLSDLDDGVEVYVELSTYDGFLKVVQDGGFKIELHEYPGHFNMYVDQELVFIYRTKLIGIRQRPQPVFDQVTQRDDYMFNEVVNRLKRLVLGK